MQSKDNSISIKVKYIRQSNEIAVKSVAVISVNEILHIMYQSTNSDIA